MIVRRSINIPKPGKGGEAVALAKEILAYLPYSGRVYRSRIGPKFGTFAVEIEVESLAELEKADAEFMASPEGIAFLEKWREVTEPFSGRFEIWALEE